MAQTALSKSGSAAPAQAERTQQRPVFTPRVDIRETDSAIILIADMPGVDESSVALDLEGSNLTIRGTFVPKAADEYTLTYQEYTNSDYERSFTLGDTIDRDNIKAVVKNGTLRLTLPKVKEVQPRRIAVQAG